VRNVYLLADIDKVNIDIDPTLFIFSYLRGRIIE